MDEDGGEIELTLEISDAGEELAISVALFSSVEWSLTMGNDADDSYDGQVDMADVIFSLNSLFVRTFPDFSADRCLEYELRDGLRCLCYSPCNRR